MNFISILALLGSLNRFASAQDQFPNAIHPPAEVDYDACVTLLHPATESPLSAPSSHPSEGLMERVGISPRGAREITLLTTNPNIGDNIVNIYGYLTHLHARYPEAKITMISPTSRILNATQWFDPVALPYLEHPDGPLFELNQIQETLRPFLKPESFYFFDTSYSINHRSLPALNWIKDSIRAAQPGTLSFFSDSLLFARGISQVSIPIHGRGIIAEADTVYERFAARGRILFGQEFALAWDPAIFHDNSAYEEASAVFLKTELGSAHRPFVILNLNTKHPIKASVSSRYYGAVTQDLVAFLRRNYPKLGILLTPPEPIFEESAGPEVRRLVGENKGHIAFLPEKNPKLWNSLNASAAAIVSQDSGFVHLANIFNAHVLSLSFTHLIRGDRWRRPGQTSIRLGARGLPNLAAEEKLVFAWLEKTLGQPNAKRSGLWSWIADLL